MSHCIVRVCRRYQNPALETLVKPYPLLAKLMSRILSLAMTPIRLLERAFPNQYTQTILYRVSDSGVASSKCLMRHPCC